MDMNNTGKFDCNIKEKDKKYLLMFSPQLSTPQLSDKYLPIRMSSLIIKSEFTWWRDSRFTKGSQAMEEEVAVSCLLSACGHGRW